MNASARRFLLVGPALFWLVVFLLIPLFLAGLISAFARDPNGGFIWGTFSSNAYVRFLFEENLMGERVLNADYVAVYIRTFAYSAITTIACLVIAIPAALWMAAQPPSRRIFYVFLITIPFWTNILIRNYAWMLLLRSGGVIESGLQLIGIEGVSLNVMYTPTATVIGLTYSFLPFMVLPIYLSFEKIERQFIEAARDLGADKLRCLTRVVMPLAAPGIVAGCVLVFVPALGSFLSADLLGGGKTMMIGNLIAAQFGPSRDWPFGAALSLILILFVLIAISIRTVIKPRRSSNG